MDEKPVPSSGGCAPTSESAVKPLAGDRRRLHSGTSLGGQIGVASPLPAFDPQPPDSGPVRPVALVGEVVGRVRAVESGLTSLLALGGIGLVLAVVAFGTAFFAPSWLVGGPLLLVLWTLLSYGVGATAVRAGISNPWIIKFKRWHRLSFDSTDRAMRAEHRLRAAEQHLDQLAQDFSGEEDPATARRVMEERIQTLKRGRGRGRPKGSHTGMDDETWLLKAREIQKLRRQGMTWDSVSRRVGVTVDTARRWWREINAMDQETA